MRTEVCICGRDNTRPHCAACGSFGVYRKARATYIKQLPDGSPVQIKVFHCKRCALDFDDLDRAACEAPNFKFGSMRERRVADGVTSALGQEILSLPAGPERQQKLRELFKRHGVVDKTQLNKYTPVEQADDFVVTPSDDVPKEDKDVK